MAASALASQLQVLASASGQAVPGRKPLAHPSILFDPREAPDIDLQTIFSLAVSGLDEMVNLDNCFEAARDSLFSQKSRQMDRDVQGRGFNANLNSSISSFLELLSGYMLLTPAHQIMEYLIRRYKIHVYNVEDVIKCILPYHETSLFVRVVQILCIEKTKWDFLQGVKKSGAALSRTVLIQQCLRDFSVLQAISEWGISLSIESGKSRIVRSFSITVVMECVGRVQKVDSDFVGRILTFVLHGFEKGVTEDFYVGSLMISGSLASKAMISQGAIETLFNGIAKLCNTGAESDKMLRLCLMLMIQLTQTQEINHFPHKAFNFLVKVSGFVEVLTELSKLFNTDKFLCLLLKILVMQSVANVRCEQILLQLLDDLPLKSYAESVICNILNIHMELMAETNSLTQGSNLMQRKAVDTMNRALLVLEKRYPRELDEGISKFLQTINDMEKTKKIVTTLREVLHGTLHAPMVESNSSLYLSLENSEASVRMLAVQQLSDFACDAVENKKVETLIVLQEAILQRLYDVDLRVVCCAISTKVLVEIVDPERLLEALISVLSRCKEVLQNGTRLMKVEANLLMRHCIQLLASGFLQKNPGYQANVGCIILSHLLHSKMWKLNMFVLNVAKGLCWDLFDGLSQVEEDVHRSHYTNKMEINASEATCCRRVINCITESLLKDHARLSMLIHCAIKYGARSLAILVLIQYFIQATTESISNTFKEIVNFLKQEWLSLELQDGFLADRLSQVCVGLDDVLFDETWGFLYLDEKIKFPRLLLVALYEAVKALPMLNTDQEEQQRTWNEMLQNLFVFFTSSPAKVVFQNHIKLILKHSSDFVLTFLSGFFTAEGSSFPVTTQVYSLELLVSEPSVGLLGSNDMNSVQVVQLQVAIPSLLVPLASPIKHVRESASDCIKKVSNFWQEHVSSLGKNGIQSLQVPLLPDDTFAAVLEALTLSLRAFVADERFLAIFLSSLLNPGNSAGKEATSYFALARLTDSCRKSIFLFILHHALLLDVYAKLALVTALQGAGHVVEQVFETQILLNTLFTKRRIAQDLHGSSSALSKNELQLLKTLLQTLLDNASVLVSGARGKSGRRTVVRALIEALNINGCCNKDPAVYQICQLALDSLSHELFAILDLGSQDELLQKMLTLGRSENEDVRLSSVSALRRIDLEVTCVVKHIDKLVSQDLGSAADTFQSAIDAISGLLEFIMWKSDLKNRQCLVAPLFRLLRKLFLKEEKCFIESPLNCDVAPYVQQLSMTALRSIISSSSIEKDDYVQDVNFDLLVKIIHGIVDITTRNEALSLLTVLAKLFPDQILNFVETVFPVLGETAVQDDSVSAEVTKELISVVVPCWLGKTKEPEKLLEVLLNALPYIPLYRRITVVKHTLSVMEEDASLHIFLFLTFRDDVHGSFTNNRRRGQIGETDIQMDWGSFMKDFREQICQQYPPSIKLPMFVRLLVHSRAVSLRQNVNKGRTDNQKFETTWSLQKHALDFIACQLKRMELQSELEFVDNNIEECFISLMKEALLMTDDCTANAMNCPSKLNKSLDVVLQSLLFSCINLLSQASFAKGITQLLVQSEVDMKLRVLQLISFKVSEFNHDSRARKHVESINSEETVLCNGVEYYSSVIKGITELLGYTGEGSLKLKLAAISALEISAVKISKILPDPFVSSLSSLIASLQSSQRLASASLHCISVIVSNVGTSMLSILPEFMPVLIDISLHYATWFNESKEQSKPARRFTLLNAILKCLESSVNSLGCFLSPYLEKILNLVIVHPAFNANNDAIIMQEAASFRALIPQKIPVRLTLDPILHLYDIALEGGETSTTSYFQTLLLVVNNLDHSSVILHYKKIFNLCIAALDLRCKPPKSFTSVTSVESSTISVLTGLALKLSESTFKPLFMRLLEWSESDTDGDEPYSRKYNIHCSITFYRVINELADKLRSIFVPYFRYLLDGCIYQLTEGDTKARHKKKIRLSYEELHKKSKHKQLTSYDWHIRQLVLSALYKCFSYDTVGFLDASKFQLLLVPIVSQISVEPPVDDNDSSLMINGPATKEATPSVDDMDKTLVLCLGQMALTAGTDLLWKTLNYEVLLCTRNESVRARRLSLEVVKFLVDHLKEEYLILLPETIPFLAELLEDSELIIVRRSQEIIKLLEDLSGESLSQYL